VRVTKYSGGLAVEKYPGVALSDSQISSVMEILRAMDGIKLYIEARSEEVTRTEDVKKIELGDSNRAFLMQARAALKGSSNWLSRRLERRGWKTFIQSCLRIQRAGGYVATVGSG